MTMEPDDTTFLQGNKKDKVKRHQKKKKIKNKKNTTVYDCSMRQIDTLSQVAHDSFFAVDHHIIGLFLNFRGNPFPSSTPHFLYFF